MSTSKNKYERIYHSIILSAKRKSRKKCKAEYYERHHIVPKSLGGTDKKSNLVLLTAREHYIVHMLLVRFVKGNEKYKMVAALARFGSFAKNSRSYELYKTTMSKYSQGDLNPSFGKIWIHHTNTKKIFYIDKNEFETKYSLDEYTKGLPYQMGGYTSDYVWLYRENERCAIPSNEASKYIENGWILGRNVKQSLEHFKKMTNARHTLEKDKRHSEILTGKIAVRMPDSNKVKRVSKSELEKFLSDGYILHKSSGMKMITSSGKSIVINGTEYKSRAEASRKTGIPYHKIVKM